MHENFQNRELHPLRNLTHDVIGLLGVLIPMSLAGLLVALVIHIVGLAGLPLLLTSWQWVLLPICAPFIYCAWLVTFLFLSAATCRQLGKRFPKPRLRTYVVGQKLEKEDLGLLTAVICYRRCMAVKSLPLIRQFESSRVLKNLVLSSWSPSVHLGKNVGVTGDIVDPDLTYIGDDVLIGEKCHIVAHSATVRTDGSTAFFSEPIKIGDRATLGGASIVSPGCIIGNDVVLEAGAVLQPFTRIPAGEVWGGNPAKFLRVRDELGAPAPLAPPVSLAAAPSSLPLDIEGARNLVAQALGVAPNDSVLDAGAASWDSLGKLAIAAALFDRHCIYCSLEEIYCWRGLADVANVVADRTVDGKAGRTNLIQASSGELKIDDFDMLPLLDPSDATRILAARESSGPAPLQHLRIAIAATFTAEQIGTTMRLWGAAFGLELECHFAPYNQVLQTLLDPAALFASNRDGINLVLVRPEDLLGAGDPKGQMRELLGAVKQFVTGEGTAGARLLVGSIPPVVSAFSGRDTAVVEPLRHEWRTGLETIEGVHLLDLARIVETLGVAESRSSGTEVLARAPYSPKLYQQLAIEVVRCILKDRRAPLKVVAVDCDNTLWGGVVGEVGPHGIQLGPDGAGRSFQLFQHYLKQLKQSGILLAVVSRNEMQDVQNVFEMHPEMVLRAEDIAAWRVNWDYKSQNLVAIATELNLGIDSIAVIDDDPAVRLEIKSRIPSAHVIPLPEDHAFWCETLSKLWLFDCAKPTEVDTARTQMMQEERQRQQDLSSAATVEEFLGSLSLEIDVHACSGMEWSRVAQLTQRTNQFNLSLRRRTVEELQAGGSRRTVLVLRARDRFGDYGLSGVAIVHFDDSASNCQLDTLLMSCRVLGRGVEDVFLHAIGLVARGRGAQQITAEFIPGPRNSQVTDFLKRTGFVEDRMDQWTINVALLPDLLPYARLKLDGELLHVSVPSIMDSNKGTAASGD